METILIRALQLICCLSLLVVLHEMGHFMFARLFRVRVEKFCLFFDPWFTLFQTKPKKAGSTAFALGWLPLGGYVKISGMIDESMDTEQMKQPVQPWEFRAKPAWQRLLIMVGGVLMNLLTAFVIYAMVLFAWGETYVPMQNIVHGFCYNEQAKNLGFADGDIPLRTNDYTFTRFDNAQSIGDTYRALSNATEVTVLRRGEEVTFAMPGDLNMLEMAKNDPPFLNVLLPSLIDSVMPGSPAAAAGIEKGDRLVGYRGAAITTWNEFSTERGRLDDILASAGSADSLAARHCPVVVLHPSGATDTLALELDESYQMGVLWHSPFTDYERTTITYSFFRAFPAGAVHGWNVLRGYVADLKYLFTKEGAQSIGSFGTIGALFPASWDWLRFWEMTAFISIILAVMNILPIPALDGGHVLFLLYETITRRRPSEKFMERAQMAGMIFLLLLMAYALFNDFLRFVF